MAKSSAQAIAALGTLGDPTRRAIVERLSKRPHAVSELSDQLPVTRSAVSQHLRVLKDNGLVTETADGTRRIYRLDPRGIGLIRDWLDQHWNQALKGFQECANGVAINEDTD